ncbi:MAG: hypothetical protein ACYTG0_31980 [Planctomycetota bacterium]|jgi:hypothetical protein
MSNPELTDEQVAVMDAIDEQVFRKREAADSPRIDAADEPCANALDLLCPEWKKYVSDD